MYDHFCAIMEIQINLTLVYHCPPPQFKEFLSQYNKITEQCFMACIHDFTTRKVVTSEVGLLSDNCLLKDILLCVKTVQFL